MNTYRIKYGTSLLISSKLADVVVIKAIDQTAAVLEFYKKYPGQLILKMKEIK